MARTKLRLRLEKAKQNQIRNQNTYQTRKSAPSPGGIKWPGPKYFRIRISKRLRIRKLFIFDRIKYKYIKSDQFLIK